MMNASPRPSRYLDKPVLDNTVGSYFLLVTLPILLSACQLTGANRQATDFNAATSPAGALPARYVKLDAQGKILQNQRLSYSKANWFCVLDQQTGLIWEIKQPSSGHHYLLNRYTWFNPNPRRNGGSSGSDKDPLCQQSACNTSAFIKHLNMSRYCGITHWRLPTREELRSLVDYQRQFPGPTIDRDFFPHTLSQFYWSSSPDAEDGDSAWGIGFSFGYDYSYLKIHAAYVRAVSMAQ